MQILAETDIDYRYINYCEKITPDTHFKGGIITKPCQTKQYNTEK